MPRRPSSRPAGRPRGSRNRATIERERRAQLELEAREAELQEGVEVIRSARREGRDLAKDVLSKLMHLGMGLTGYYQQNPPGAPVNTNENWDKFWLAANFTKECAIGLANYESPKLKATVSVALPHRPEPDVPLLPAPAPGSTNVQLFLETRYRRMLKQVG